MKKFPIVCLFALVTTLSALAQNSYRYDNFDVQGGVRIDSVQTTATLPSSNNVRKTAKVVTGNASPRAGLILTRANSRPEENLYTPARVGSNSPNAMSSNGNASLNMNGSTSGTGLAMAAGKSLKGFTTGDAIIDGYIVDSSLRNGIDPMLIYAQMHTESSFKRMAVSSAGARGLMQLMPGTAARFGVKNIFDPQQNIEGGVRYMRFLLDAFNGDVSLALAGYNAGEGAVMKYGRRIPPYHETQEYVRRISERYSMIRNGEMARGAQTPTRSQLTAMRETPAPVAPPQPAYDRAVFAVRLPDGRLQLISQ